jgi:hypothetical protein
MPVAAPGVPFMLPADTSLATPAAVGSLGLFPDSPNKLVCEGMPVWVDDDTVRLASL